MKTTIGYAFGGGGAKAFTQLGALSMLEKFNIKPDYMAGTSMGAVNAILYAAGYSVDEIVEFYNSATIFKLFGLKITKYGFATNKKLGALIEDMCKAKGYNELQDLPIPVYVTATDIDNNPATVKKGSIKDAVRATTAAIFFENLKTENGEILKDGGFTRNVPFEVLDEIRIDKNINAANFDFCLDCIPNRFKARVLNNYNKQRLQFNRERKEIFKATKIGCYVDLINPYSPVDFNPKALDDCLRLGEEAMLKEIPSLKEYEHFKYIFQHSLASKQSTIKDSILDDNIL